MNDVVLKQSKLITQLYEYFGKGKFIFDRGNDTENYYYNTGHINLKTEMLECKKKDIR